MNEKQVFVCGGINWPDSDEENSVEYLQYQLLWREIGEQPPQLASWPKDGDKPDDRNEIRVPFPSQKQKNRE